MRPSAGMIVPYARRFVRTHLGRVWRERRTYLFELENIPGDNVRGLNLVETAVAQNSRLESKGFLQFIDNGSSLEFLDESDGCVQQEEGADHTKIDPVLETGSEHGGSLPEA
jgi:hypothetical protein